MKFAPDDKETVMKTDPKVRRVRCEVNPGRERYSENPDPNVGRLAVVLKEVLQLIPDEQAEKLMDAYMDGKSILVALAPSKHGFGCKTAFQCAIGDARDASTPILSRKFEMEGVDRARETICVRGGLHPAMQVSGMLPPDSTVN